MHTARLRFDQLAFGSRFTDALPADPDTGNYPRQVPGAGYSWVTPSPAPAPQLLAHSPEVAADLGLAADAYRDPLFTEVLAGNRLLPGMAPHASCYGGHQFGHWAGQLGDGRAINLGETRGLDGEYRTLQLKGAGLTPYSRSADGRAVLRSSVREFLCSEAMHHLGIPTTRALSLITTGQSVIRDMFYDGHPRPEPGAVVCRVAPSFTRFGHFELFAARGELDLLRRLADFTLRTDFPHLDAAPGPATYADWFEDICQRTATLIVHWQRVGFVHGVMNTDNMSILGLTIDYGPYGWLEPYDPDWTPNTTDAGGRRYRFGHQPQIAYWNLVRLANALYPLIENTGWLERGLNRYVSEFEQGWQRMMAAKLGLSAFDPARDAVLVDELLDLLAAVETDMTLFFRNLALITPSLATADEAQLLAPLETAWYQPELPGEHRVALVRWLHRYLERVQADPATDSERQSRMRSTNPLFVLRNYMAQEAIDRAEQGDPARIIELLEVLRHPYDDQPGREHFARKRPDWARNRAGCSMLSCSS